MNYEDGWPLECPACEADNDWVGHNVGCVNEKPDWFKACGVCLQTVEHWQGQDDVSCECGSKFDRQGRCMDGVKTL